MFLKSKDLKLVNGGYLVTKDDTPVFNEEFVSLQQHAEYIITFAKLAKGKDFVGKPADSIESLQTQVKELLYSTKNTVFIASPTVVGRPVTESLKLEALAFLDFQDSLSDTTKINAFLQQFKLLAEFEEFGLFFTEDVVKLNRIYTMKEVINAVTSTIKLLN